MATLPSIPQLDEFSAAMALDPLDLASDLAGALQILEQCQSRNATPGEELLDYVEWLIEQVEMLQAFGRIKAA